MGLAVRSKRERPGRTDAGADGLCGWEPSLLRGLFVLSPQLLAEQRGGFAGAGAQAASRALTQPAAIAAPEEPGSEAWWPRWLGGLVATVARVEHLCPSAFV